MSTAKHRFYRKVLSVNTQIVSIGGISTKARTVLWCVPISITPRVVKSERVCVSVYVGGLNHGIEYRAPKKPVSINLKNPEGSKCFEKWNLQEMIQEAYYTAGRRFILATPALSQNISGVVKWFRRDDGEGAIETALGTFRVYACNIKGAKTWYPETACMYLKEGETVQFDLADMGDHPTPSKVRGNVYFDKEKWDSLDQSRLAFKCDEDGNAINGLFAPGVSSW